MTETDPEIWENTVEASLFVQIRDRRTPGAWVHTRVSGKDSGNHRLRITAEEREFNQENIPPKNRHLDPFTNGTLICVSRVPRQPKGKYELTDADLRDMLAIEDDEEFNKTMRGIEFEVPLRRLLALAERHSPNSRFQAVKEFVDERYRVGGTQRTVQEMIDAGERIGHTMLS